MIKMVHTAAVLMMLAAVGCQQHKGNAAKDIETKENVQPPLHLGAVHQVYPEQGFALLRMIGPVPRAGAVLVTHPANGEPTRIANLVVTSDRPTQNRFIAAEIRSGSPMQGDRVFMYRNIAQPVEKPAEEEQTETPVPANIPNTPTPVFQPNTPQDYAPIIEETVVNEDETPEKKAPKQHETPKHILDIPDNIDDWD